MYTYDSDYVYVISSCTCMADVFSFFPNDCGKNGDAVYVYHHEWQQELVIIVSAAHGRVLQSS